MKRITLLILQPQNRGLLWETLEIENICSIFAVLIARPLEKGRRHRAFSPTRKVLYFFYAGCILPEVMDLNFIQWVNGNI